MRVERVQCSTSHTLLIICTTAARVDAAIAAGVVAACCAALRAHPGAERTTLKTLQLLYRCVTTSGAADSAGTRRSILEHGGAALADAALRAHCGSQTAPPADGEDNTLGTAAAVLLCLLMSYDARAALTSAPDVARTLLAVPRAHVRGSGMLAASVCAGGACAAGWGATVSGGPGRLRRAAGRNVWRSGGQALRGGATRVLLLVSELPYLGRLALRRERSKRL
jgi:hypothetical protein